MKNLKFVFVGPTGAGKTACIQKLARKQFTENFTSTQAVGFQLYNYQQNEMKRKIELWDMIGPPAQNPIMQIYCKNVDAFFIVVDVADPCLDQTLHTWAECADRLVGEYDGIPQMLVLNKCDIISGNDMEEMKQKVEKMLLGHRFNKICWTSAKTGLQLKETIGAAVDTLPMEPEGDDEDQLLKTIQLQTFVGVKKKEKCCC